LALLIDMSAPASAASAAAAAAAAAAARGESGGEQAGLMVTRRKSMWAMSRQKTLSMPPPGIFLQGSAENQMSYSDDLK
jgi:hypothetical protein